MDFPFSKNETKDAARLGIQSAIAASALYVLMQTLSLPEKFVGVLSAVLVISPSVGNTLGNAWQRVISTAVGVLVGILCMVVLPSGYGTAVALGVSMLVMNVIGGLWSEWRYGVVAAVALALGSESDLWETAKDRTISIALGVVVGSLASIVVWPDKSSARTERFLKDAIRTIAQFLGRSVDDTRAGEYEREQTVELKRKYAGQISGARRSADNVRLADDSQLHERVEAVDQVYQAVLILDRVSEESEGDGNAVTENGDELLGSVRELACDMLLRIADDDQSSESSKGREEIKNEIEELREVAFGSESKVDERLTLAQALVFALDELEDGLGLLERAYGSE